MPDLKQSLHNHDLGHLRILAEAWGVELANTEFRQALIELSDNLLDVMIVGDIGKFELLKTLPRVYKGTHITHPNVRMEKTTHITIESSERILVHADGELLGEAPASFWLMPSALSIVV